MKPMEAAVVGALISGVAMYAVGARAQNDMFVETPGLEAPALTTQFQPGFTQVQPGFTQVSNRSTTSPRRTVSRAPAQQARVIREAPVVVEEERSNRDWSKTALIIGGAAASGAGVGGIVNGKKGALIGAAVGGGAASIYEATRR